MDFYIKQFRKNR